ncbi:hypothetical protein Tco_0794582 [Tanacetum coccineum]
MTESPLIDSGFVVPVFSPGDYPIACLNKAMTFLTAVASSRFPATNNQLRTSSNPRNQATIQDGRVTVQQVRGDKGKIILVLPIRVMLQIQGEILQVGRQELLSATTAKVKDIWSNHQQQPKRANGNACINPGIPSSQAQTVIPNNAAFHTEDLNTYDSDYNDLSNAQAVLMANISNYGSDVILEIEISSDSNIIPYSQYLQETQQANVQDTHLQAQQDSMILSVIEQMLSKSVYLKKAQRIKPTLYDGVVMSNTHVAMHVIDDEETLILEEESRSKMFEKAKDPEVIAKKISHKPIDYEKLNSLIDDFGKRFSPQQEFSAEQAFWFHTLNPTIEPSYTPPVIVEVPSELPKVSLVNASLKKLKFYLTQFDSVVNKRTTPSALKEGEWGFEHTKTIFNNEIIPFLKSLKDIFNVFDKDLLNEITEVQTIFEQMEASVQQFSVDKKCLKIAKKEILLENDRLFD